MHDIWNPWHGCVKCSEGCRNCYMFVLDKQRNADGSLIYRTKNGFDYPLQRNRDGSYKIQSGELIRICMTSDFLLPEADIWRNEVWSMIAQRPDVIFYILTKRPERMMNCLPKNWNFGYENVFFNVTCENQRRADERIPILKELPFKHKGIMTAPLIGPINIQKYLEEGFIELVICGGENYDKARNCDFEWIKELSRECRSTNTTFCLIETGTNFVKDGRLYNMPSKELQSKMAFKSGVNFKGKEINFKLTDPLGIPLQPQDLYVRKFPKARCNECGARLICNGCSECGSCY